MRQTYKNWITGAVVAAIAASPLTAGFAFADTSASSGFALSYQHNAGVESGLMQQAQTGMPASPTAQEQSAQTAVQSIAAQITALYGAEQSLAGSVSSLPNITTVSGQRLSASVSSMSRQRANLLNAANHAWQQMNVFKRHHERSNYNREAHLHAALASKLGSIDRKIAQAEGQLQVTAWHSHPYDYGLSSLQHAVLQLQLAQIHYTRVWIALEKAGSTTPATSPSSAAVAVPGPSGMPSGVVTSITAVFSINGSSVQQVAVPVTAYANGIVAFAVPTGLAAGTYTVTVTFTVNGSTYSSVGSYTVG